MKKERFKFPGRKVIVMLVIFLYIQIADDYVYKSTSADS